MHVFLISFMLVLGAFWAPFWIPFALHISLKNVFQISLIFWIILGWILGPFGLQFGSQNWSKIDPGRSWGKGSPQKHAREPEEPQKATKMEPKLSPEPSKSSLRPPQGFKNGAPDPLNGVPDSPWIPQKGPGPELQNNAEINQRFIRKAKSEALEIQPNEHKLDTRLEPTCNQPGTNIWLTNTVTHLQNEMPQQG